MKGTIIAMLFGALIAGWVWYSLGETVARWRRARADFRKAIADAKRLIKLLWHLSQQYARYAAILLLLLAAAIAGLLR